VLEGHPRGVGQGSSSHEPGESGGGERKKAFLRERKTILVLVSLSGSAVSYSSNGETQKSKASQYVNDIALFFL
jgi:hypothetical protein